MKVQLRSRWSYRNSNVTDKRNTFRTKSFSGTCQLSVEVWMKELKPAFVATYDFDNRDLKLKKNSEENCK